jgi:hypothetical protein
VTPPIGRNDERALAGEPTSATAIERAIAAAAATAVNVLRGLSAASPGTHRGGFIAPRRRWMMTQAVPVRRSAQVVPIPGTYGDGHCRERDAMTSTPPNEPAEPPREPDPAAAPEPPHAPPPAVQSAAFAPVARPPRVPWVNPDRRSHVIGAAIIGGLVVLASGFGIGYASSGGHDRHGPQRMERGGGPHFQGPPGQFRPRDRQFPGDGTGRQRVGPRGGQPAPSSSAATPTPTNTN